MKLTVFLSHNVFAAFLLLLYAISGEARNCDLKWVRLMYMLSCGRKKREVSRPPYLTDILPTDVESAIQYFRDKDPSNPLFNEDSHILIKMLNSEEGFPLPVEGHYMKRSPEKVKSRIDRLLDRCCRVGAQNNCTGDDFLGAC
ncbi:UNVERIFIED_CONTAM: hypothetical protein PYX00_010488 [Menopon gallinae]|uniref:Uncharacterized protein n=1 Tax=Menopon gallinae TaxID=328185 RepID=A0AAW2HFY8_9NEOP